MTAHRKLSGRLCLAIDPSTTCVGIALGVLAKPMTPNDIRYHSVISPKASNGYINRVDEILEVLAAMRKSQIQVPNPVCVIECPEAFHTPKGIRAATSGAVGKLNFAVGAIYAWAKSVGMQTLLVPVHVWKGQLPKLVVLRRLRRRGFSPDETRGLDESDALGLLVWTGDHHA